MNQKKTKFLGNKKRGNIPPFHAKKKKPQKYQHLIIIHVGSEKLTWVLDYKPMTKEEFILFDQRIIGNQLSMQTGVRAV